MLQGDIIEESVSPWSSPRTLVPKKNGSNQVCINFQNLNAHTVKDSFPLPRIEEVLYSLHGACGFPPWICYKDIGKLGWQMNPKRKPHLPQLMNCTNSRSYHLGYLMFQDCLKG